MDYTFKQYEIETKKNMELEETKIITLSDLNWNTNITNYEINDLIVRINDIIPKYVFILGNITTYDCLQNELFQKKISYFFELLSCITKTYMVFGSKDYEIEQNEKKKYTSIDSLIEFYKTQKVTILDNSVYKESDLNIIGLNLNPANHYNVNERKKKIEELIKRIDNIIDNNKFNVLLTHSDMSALKNEKDLLSYFDLIFSKSFSPIPSSYFFHCKRKEETKIPEEEGPKFIIENKGIHAKNEMDLIKIKKIQK